MTLPKPYFKTDNIIIYHGDCLDILPQLPDDFFDSVITDPPYLKEYLFLYGEIAKISKEKLKRGGSFISIVPHYGLPTVLNDVSSFLKFRWICSMWQGDGQHPRMAMGIEVMWKPVVWWVKEAWPKGRGFVRDGFENTHDGKKLHKWQQGMSWGNYCVKFSPDNGCIIDPFMGSGTTAIACIKANRKFIGIEKEEEYCEIAVKRIKDELSQKEKDK